MFLMKIITLFLFTFFLAVDLQAQNHLDKMFLDDLRINDTTLIFQLYNRFINDKNILEGEKGKGVFWIKFFFNSKGIVEKFEISSGATTSINKFLIRELKNIYVRKKDFEFTGPTKVILPVKYFIYPLTKVIPLNNDLMLDFFSASEKDNGKLIILPTIYLTTVIS